MADQDITLKDVISHMQHMEQRLMGEITEVKTIVKSHSIILESHSAMFDRVFLLIQELRERIDSLEEDLVATMKDLLTVRRHVGIGAEDGE